MLAKVNRQKDVTEQFLLQKNIKMIGNISKISTYNTFELVKC